MNSTGGVGLDGELASQNDFAIGALNISPSTGRAFANGVEARVEPRVMEVLLVLWRAAGKTVSRDQLIEACWGRRAVSEDAVTRAVGKVRQLAVLGGGPHFTIETLPKVGFRFTCSAAAPASPLPSPNDTPTAAGRQTFSLIGTRVRRLLGIHPGFALATLALVIVIAVSGLLLSRSRDELTDDGTIRVSPFVAIRHEPSIDGLVVRSRDAIVRMLAAAGLRTRVTGAASEPRASGLEIIGALDHQGGYHSAQVSIVDGADHAVLWSGKFDSTGAQGEGLDAEVAGVLADALTCAMRERRRTPHISRHLWTQLLNACADVSTSKEQALDITKELLSSLPDDPNVLALRAAALASHANSMDQFKAEASAMIQEAIDDARRAIVLDPNNVSAHVTLGRPLGQAPRFIEREQNLQRARALDPSAGRVRYISLLREVGRIRAALEIARGLEWDIDERKQAEVQTAFLYAMSGDLVGAHRALDRIQATLPAQAASVRLTVALWWEDPRFLNDEFWRTYKDQMADWPCLQRYFSTLAHSDGGARGLPIECNAIDPDWRIRLLAREGDIDGAYASAEDGMPNSRRWMFLFYPEMKTFRHDRRFEALVERLGLLNYWRTTGNWPDFCRDEASISFCPGAK